jgi:hypothetical protein
VYIRVWAERQLRLFVGVNNEEHISWAAGHFDVLFANVLWTNLQGSLQL